jgi:hypothetical protein
MNLIEDCPAWKIKLNGTSIAEPITLICETESRKSAEEFEP